MVVKVQDQSIEQYMKVVRTVQKAICTIISSMKREIKNKKKVLIPRHHWIIFSREVDRIESSK